MDGQADGMSLGGGVGAALDSDGTGVDGIVVGRFVGLGCGKPNNATMAFSKEPIANGARHL